MEREQSGEHFVESALLRMIADQLPAMLAYWDANEHCRFANRAYEMWFGVKPESIIGRDMESLLGPLYVLNKPYIEAALRGEEQHFERVIPDPHGGPARHSQALYLPDRAPDGSVRGFIVLVVDISRSKRAEEALRSVERQLQASERLTAMATLASGIAHEINNPLAVIVGTIELVLANPQVSDDDRASLGDARTSARRIADLVKSMKLLARPETGEREIVDVNDTLEQSARLASHVLKHRARLVFDLRDVPPVIANASQLAQVFVNLLVNAAHSFSGERREHDEIRITSQYQADAVVVEIADTGSGIAPELQLRIFEPFFTTKDVGQGTGLGLSTARSIVGGFGGQLTVTSQVGAGSTFRVVIPSVEERVQSPPAPAAKTPHGERLRILIVDDDTLVASKLQRMLSSSYDVTVVGDGHAGLALLVVDDPPFDVVLCDLMMPEVNGAQVFETAVAKHPTLEQRFIVMTGGAFTAASRAFLDTARVPVLEKPFTINQLREVVESRRPRPLQPVE